MLHVNEFLADEVGRIAVLFPAGKDDVAQALGIGALHAFLPGAEPQVVPRALGRVGPGAAVRHGQDAVPDAGGVDARGVFCRVDFQAVARIEVQGAVLHNGQAVTGFDAADVPGRGRAVVAGVLGAPGPVLGIGRRARRLPGAVRRVCRAPGRPRGAVARGPGGSLSRVPGGINIPCDTFRTLLGGRRNLDRPVKLGLQLPDHLHLAVELRFQGPGVHVRGGGKVRLLGCRDGGSHGQYRLYGNNPGRTQRDSPAAGRQYSHRILRARNQRRFRSAVRGKGYAHVLFTVDGKGNGIGQDPGGYDVADNDAGLGNHGNAPSGPDS